MKIQATVVADTLSPQGHRLTTLQITFPRMILSELNTHRILSKNSASSRAIPFAKMLKAVIDNPFIPIAWQKEHKGMQGTEYITDVPTIQGLQHWWFTACNEAVEEAISMAELGCTKQLCNRLLETYMWHTVLISGTEWENFFHLRCPQYVVNGESPSYFMSRKALLNSIKDFPQVHEAVSKRTEVEWLQQNKGQAEIHMMALAEAIWDAMNESGPTLRYAGQWHIPFRGKIDGNLVDDTIEKGKIFKPGEYNTLFDINMVKIATAMAARTSYTVVGDEKEVSYERLIAIHDGMAVAKPFHASPFEHCAPVMSDEEFELYTHEMPMFPDIPEGSHVKKDYGWCRNFRGFIQYRHILESQK